MNGPKEGSLGRATEKVRRQEEDPPDDGGKENPMDPFTPKMVSFRDMEEIIDGVPSIDFSERVHSLIEKSMSKIIIVKLFGRKICYNALWNKAYTNFLSRGPWVIFEHYLTVQPWMPQFTTLHPYPHKVVAWICIPNLSRMLYEKSILKEIGEMIVTVIKIDLQTNKNSMGQFARFFEASCFKNLDCQKNPQS
ncbi:hypothetical protein Gogos_022143 [Gossypium gossypioides]|uniref:DUF4283 domain-containing protein n=1 Tax=Gossypium gossypioides TaxID=34282 RepID=A0A7J9CZ64_GOSGO|nr:hypothetical protein [Gossypium gossypioides]